MVHGRDVGTASRAGMVDKDGNMPRMREALLADAVGTVAGACTGTSTVTTFVESASGVEAGGRTGLTALTTGVLFLESMFHGIGLGLISYSVLKLCTGKGKDVSVLTYVISLIFLVKFFLVA